MITHVAIFLDGNYYALPKPKRHRDVREYLIEQKHPQPLAGVMGFIAEGNKFLDRKEAAVYALSIGQIEELQYVDDELFSEDLW